MLPLQSCFLLTNVSRTPEDLLLGSRPQGHGSFSAQAPTELDRASSFHVHSGQAAPQPRTHSHIPFALISALGNLGVLG